MSYFLGLGLGISLVKGDWRRTLLTLVPVFYAVIWRSKRSRNPLSMRLTMEKSGPYSSNTRSADGDAVPALWVAMMVIADVVRSKPRRDSINNTQGEQKPSYPERHLIDLQCVRYPLWSPHSALTSATIKRARPALHLQVHAQRCMLATRQAMRLEACLTARSDLASGPLGVHYQPSCT